MTKTSRLLFIASSTGQGTWSALNYYLLNLQTVGHMRNDHGQEQGEEKCALRIGRVPSGSGGKEGKTKDEMMASQKILPVSLEETGL